MCLTFSQTKQNRIWNIFIKETSFIFFYYINGAICRSYIYLYDDVVWDGYWFICFCCHNQKRNSSILSLVKKKNKIVKFLLYLCRVILCTISFVLNKLISIKKRLLLRILKFRALIFVFNYRLYNKRSLYSVLLLSFIITNTINYFTM